MLLDIRKLPLEVLAWERIEFRRGVGFGVEIQVSTPELDIGVELLTQLVSIRNTELSSKSEFPGAQRRLWRDLQPHSAL